jgi:hypothetical protein
MFKCVKAVDIKRNAGLTIPPPGKRCHITIDSYNRLEMVYIHMKTKPGGVVWFFVCPVTKKLCRKLYLIKGKYVHRSTIKGFYRKFKPAWITGTKLDKVFKRLQQSAEAEKIINQKYFKPHYAGKPTKQFLKCVKNINDAKGISLHSLINGHYDHFLKTTV